MEMLLFSIGVVAIAKHFNGFVEFLFRQGDWPAFALWIMKRAFARRAVCAPAPPALAKLLQILFQAMLWAVLLKDGDSIFRAGSCMQHRRYCTKAHKVGRSCHPVCRPPLELPLGA